MTPQENLLYEAIKRELDLFRGDVRRDIGAVDKKVDALGTGVKYLGAQVQELQGHDRDAEVERRTKTKLRQSVVKIVLGASAISGGLGTLIAVFVK